MVQTLTVIPPQHDVHATHLRTHRRLTHTHTFTNRYSRVRPEASSPTEAAIGDVPAEAIFARDDSVSPDSWVKDSTTGVYTLELTTPGIASKSVHVHIVGKPMIKRGAVSNE